MPLRRTLESGVLRALRLVDTEAESVADATSWSARRYTHELVEARRHPRYKLQVNIRVYPRNAAVERGETVDISESGMSAMLRGEVPLGEVVRLEFSVPAGNVELHALVRQRNAFRYGFQFVESSSAQDLIGRTCRDLALEQAVQDPKPQ